MAGPWSGEHSGSEFLTCAVILVLRPFSAIPVLLWIGGLRLLMPSPCTHRLNDAAAAGTTTWTRSTTCCAWPPSSRTCCLTKLSCRSYAAQSTVKGNENAYPSHAAHSSLLLHCCSVKLQPKTSPQAFRWSRRRWVAGLLRRAATNRCRDGSAPGRSGKALLLLHRLAIYPPACRASRGETRRRRAW